MQSLFMRSLLSPSLFTRQVRTFMPRPGKSKTHKGAAARFVIPDGAMQKGNIFRHRAGKAHLNIKKSSGRLRRLRQMTLVSKSQVKAMLRLLGR